jgi:hypothetical protein
MTSAIARGARLSREPLNTFLSSKSASTIEGSRIYPENNAALTKLLHGLGLDPKIRVRAIMPIGRNSKGSSYIFVCWEWNYVLYAKEIGTALPGRGIPTGFKEAVQKIQKDAAFGVWCVSLTDEWGVMKDELADSVRMHQSLFWWQEAACTSAFLQVKNLAVAAVANVSRRKFTLADSTDNSSPISRIYKNTPGQRTIYPRA